MNRRTFFAALAGVLASPFIPVPKPKCYICGRTDNVVWHQGYNLGCGYHRCEKPCWNDRFFSGSEPGIVLVAGDSVGVSFEKAWAERHKFQFLEI